MRKKPTELFGAVLERCCQQFAERFENAQQLENFIRENLEGEILQGARSILGLRWHFGDGVVAEGSFLDTALKTFIRPMAERLAKEIDPPSIRLSKADIKELQEHYRGALFEEVSRLLMKDVEKAATQMVCEAIQRARCKETLSAQKLLKLDEDPA
jgi:hypothetical protein